MAAIYYEQGTGAWGDASNLIILPAPDESITADEDTLWEHIEAATDSFQYPDILDVLIQVRDREGDYLGALDRLIAVLDA